MPGQASCCVCFILFIFGPVFVFVSLGLLLGTNVLETVSLVGAYEDAITAWDSNLSAEYLDFINTMMVSILTSDPAWGGPILMNIAKEDIIYPQGPVTRVYNRVYLLSNTALIRPQPFQFHKTVNFTILITNTTSDKTQLLFSSSAVVMKQNTIPYFNPNDCQIQNGFWDNNTSTCNERWVASQFCIKLAKYGSSWVANDSYGGFGCGFCGPNDNGSYWDIVGYEKLNPVPIPFIDLEGTDAYASVDDNLQININAQIRHHGDPLVIASVLTNGSFTFDHAKRIEWIVILVLLAFGSVCSLVFITAVVCFVKLYCSFKSSTLHLSS